MKILLTIILFLSFLNGWSQVDKAIGWKLPQKGTKQFSISNNNKKDGSYFYASTTIKPTEIKNLHIEIATESSLDSSLKKEKYLLQIKSGDKAILNQQVEYDGFLKDKFATNIALGKADTVISINCFRPAYVRDTVIFKIKYTFGDTAALDYRNQNPEAVFNRMLELAPVGFINLAGVQKVDIFFFTKKIKYDKGLFAKLPAEKYSYGSFVTQFTALNETNKIIADSAYLEWNIKISNWLKAYHVTDIKRTGKDDLKINFYDESTIYIKRNESGAILFKVEVFKTLNKTVSKVTGKTLEEFYSSGVRIAAD